MVSHTVPHCVELSNYIRSSLAINGTFKLLFRFATYLGLSFIIKNTNTVFPVFWLDVSKSMSARQKLETQLTENNIVKEVTNI